MNQQKTIPADASALPVNIDDIRAEHERIAASIVRTPTLLSRTLSSIVGAHVYLKFENLHFTAAYKERGPLNRLLLLRSEEGRVGEAWVSPCRSLWSPLHYKKKKRRQEEGK